MEHIISEHMENCKESPYGIVGIGIGIYGVVHKNRIVFTPYYPLPAPNLSELLSGRFQIPVFSENESNFSVLGESAFRCGYQNMIHINVHDGIGMGILVNGKLYKGQDGYAGNWDIPFSFQTESPAPVEMKAAWNNMLLNGLS